MALEQQILNTDQRDQWNGYLDSLNGQEVSPETMAAYAQSNPDFSLTAEHLLQIQAEHAAIRTGDSFGDMTADQLAKMRQGMSDSFLNETNLNKSYYPTFQKGGDNFGTDVDAYLGGGDPKVVKKPSDAKPTSSVPPAPAGVIRPDYSNPTSRAQYLKMLASQPGNEFISGKFDGVKRGDTIIHIDEVPTYGNISNKQAAIKEAAKQGLDPALLYSSTMEEGANGLFPDKNGEINTGEGTSDKYPVSGFGNYGVDNFHGDFKELVRKGYLPKNFDYEPSYHENENGDKVPSANFKNTEDAMAAKAAYVHLYQDKLDDYAKESGIKLTPTAKQFFTLIGFNGGPGTAKKLIRYYQSKGLLKDDKFLNVDPGREVDKGNAYNHVHARFQMANLLRKEKYFE